MKGVVREALEEGGKAKGKGKAEKSKGKGKHGEAKYNIDMYEAENIVCASDLEDDAKLALLAQKLSVADSKNDSSPPQHGRAAGGAKSKAKGKPKGGKGLKDGGRPPRGRGKGRN